MTHILFDMDGVLVQSEHLMRKSAKLALLEYGVTANDEDFTDFVGMGEDLFVGGVAEKHGVPYKSEMKRRAYDIYINLVKYEIVRYDGVYPLLEFIRENRISSAVASSADRIKVDANLNAADIPPNMFKAIITGNDVTRKKPHPDIYLHTAEKLNADPENCLVVEDAISGLQAAKTANMKCAMVTTSFDRKTLEQYNPDYILNDISELISIIKADYKKSA